MNNEKAETLGTFDDPLSLNNLLKGTRKSDENQMPNEKKKGFVRQKLINGRPYYYLVETVYIDGKPRQKVLKYLGTSLPKGYRLGSLR